MMESFTKSHDKIYYNLDEREAVYTEALYRGADPELDKRASKVGWLAGLAAAALYLGYPEVTKRSPQENKVHAAQTYNDALFSADLARRKSVEGILGKKERDELFETAKEIAAIIFLFPEEQRDEVFNSVGVVPTSHRHGWDISNKDHTSVEAYLQSSIIRIYNHYLTTNWAKNESTMNTFKTFEKEVSSWITEADSKFDQDIFNILSDMEAQLETGEYSQEETVDTVSDRLQSELGKEISTEEGARIEQKVEDFYGMLGLEAIPADRRSRDYLLQQTPDPAESSKSWTTGTNVAPKVKGQPWVHSDDDFIEFLRWLVKRENDEGDLQFSAQTIVDVVERPDKYQPEYTEFLDWKQRVDNDPYL